jgi:phosphoglycolate phosphatase (TIGR01487 family)
VSRARGRPLRAIPEGLRAVVTDIDGTLTDRHRRLDPGAVEAVRYLEAHGVPVILATGNVLPIALALYRSLGLSGPIVAENGGLLYRQVGGADRLVRLCDRRPALRALRRIRRAGIPVRSLFTDRWRETEVAIEPTVSVPRLRRAVGDLGVVVESTGYAIHLMEAGGGKLPGLRRAVAEVGLSLPECLVAGDGDNDVPMLRAAGYSISFPTASPRARAAADLVSRARYAQGFVEGLMRVGLVPPSGRVGRP